MQVARELLVEDVAQFSHFRGCRVTIYPILYTYRTCPVRFLKRARTNLGRAAGRDLHPAASCQRRGRVFALPRMSSGNYPKLRPGDTLHGLGCSVVRCTTLTPQPSSRSGILFRVRVLDRFYVPN